MIYDRDKSEIHTRITKDTKKRLKEIGKGCIADGIETLVEFYYQKQVTVRIVTELKM